MSDQIDWAKVALMTARQRDQLAAEVESLRAARRTVDEVLDGSHNDAAGALVVYVTEVRRALNGEA